MIKKSDLEIFQGLEAILDLAKYGEQDFFLLNTINLDILRKKINKIYCISAFLLGEDNGFKNVQEINNISERNMKKAIEDFKNGVNNKEIYKKALKSYYNELEKQI